MEHDHRCWEWRLEFFLDLRCNAVLCVFRELRGRKGGEELVVGVRGSLSKKLVMGDMGREVCWILIRGTGASDHFDSSSLC